MTALQQEDTHASSLLLGAINYVLEHGKNVKPRGLACREVLATQLVLTDPRNRFVIIPHRRWSLAYAAGELAWYLRGSADLEAISYYAPSYRRFSDDGKTLHGAYGPRIFGANELNDDRSSYSPWQHCVELLRKDPDTRQAVIPILRPSDVGKETKDYPCTLSLQFLLRQNQLHLITSMRSNDLWYGAMYDVFCFTVLQELMANEIGAQLGEYVHLAGSSHLYEVDASKARLSLRAWSTMCDSKVPTVLTMDPSNFIERLVFTDERLRSVSLDQVMLDINNLLGATELCQLDLMLLAWCWKRAGQLLERDSHELRSLEETIRRRVGVDIFENCFN